MLSRTVDDGVVLSSQRTNDFIHHGCLFSRQYGWQLGQCGCIQYLYPGLVGSGQIIDRRFHRVLRLLTLDRCQLLSQIHVHLGSEVHRIRAHQWQVTVVVERHADGSHLVHRD
ncbi:hypothetical protein D3C86_1637110 [compost metagenome]